MNSNNGLLPLLEQFGAMVAANGGGGTGLGGLMGAAGGGATLGPNGIAGSGSLFGPTAGMGGAALPNTPPVPSGMPSQFSMPAGVGPSAMSPQMMQAALGLMQQGQPQQGQPMSPQQVAFGNPSVRSPNIGPAMPYLSVPGVQPFGFGGVPYV